jgi:hypothetical protein
MSHGHERDVFGEIIDMFWCEDPLLESRESAALLRSFLEWMDLRRKGGSIVDLRLVRNKAAQITVNHIMNGGTYDPER